MGSTTAVRVSSGPPASTIASLMMLTQSADTRFAEGKVEDCCVSG